MKKSIIILALCFVLLFAVAAVSAQEVEEAAPAQETAEAPAGFKVTYKENDCLAEVPTDENAYVAGDEVTVLFEPVKYKDYMIFYGWDANDDGIADYGYAYNTFEMPEEDVELKAICIGGGAGSTCKGCHLHGRPGSGGIKTFTPTWPDGR